MRAPVSYMCSEWHPWFVEMGYPRLDIRRFWDGEWAILEYHTTPIVPALTKWNWVLQGMRNVEITRSFVEKYVELCDTSKRAFWEREERAAQKVERERAAVERHAEDSAARAAAAIIRNPDLMERIARGGLREMDISVLERHIPSYKL